ncbi:MAG: hypothetical protein II306_08360 [Clostridia bacterium]|nr:hypothetical protein [Clostridia bacterium]MEE1023528.1 hypothetical protein [Acutalibacteraceae bacterium]
MKASLKSGVLSLTVSRYSAKAVPSHFIPDGATVFCAVPLKIDGVEATPARALLIKDYLFV